ncbi:mce related protein [mine drainage metagenome]|jgi:phospholipid/cholesterol/gamma-HCH transport system substrate-binding protein|uniref:Mce related protein n=1 Tax=mine drainage metagenome TaxID=410659 RepID=A0A1J5R5V3_9ZZZZ
MESRVNYTAVGAFVVLLGLALAGAIWWLAQAHQHGDTDHYLIYATDNVNGLRTSSDVLYRGVRVGRVASISIDPNNPALVRIEIDLARGVPVRTDTVAQLSPQGVTGLSVINLSGGHSTQPLLARPGQPEPVIPYAPSVFSRLEGGLDTVTVTLSRISSRLDELLSPANVRAVSGTLRHLNELSGTLAAHRDDLGATLVQLRQASAQLVALGAHGEQLSAQGRELLLQLDTDARQLQRTLDAVDAAAASWHDAGAGASQLARNGNRALDRLQQRTLPGVDRLGDRLGQLSEQLTELVRSLRANPAQLLYGVPQPPPGPGESR